MMGGEELYNKSYKYYIINCGDYEISRWARVFAKRIFHKGQIV